MAYSKQDARFKPPMLNLDAYDKNAMLEDLGAHRKASLPLSGRPNFHPPPPPNIYKRGEALARKALGREEVVSQWAALYDPSLDEDRDDGLGSGQSHRTGPNYRPSPVGNVNRRKSPPRRRSLSPRGMALAAATSRAHYPRAGVAQTIHTQRRIRPRRPAPSQMEDEPRQRTPNQVLNNSSVLKSVLDNPPHTDLSPSINSPAPGTPEGSRPGYPTYVHSHAGFGSYTPIPIFSDHSPSATPSPMSNRPKNMENPAENPYVAHWHTGMLMTNKAQEKKLQPKITEDIQSAIKDRKADEKGAAPILPQIGPKAVPAWTGGQSTPTMAFASQNDSGKQPVSSQRKENAWVGDKPVPVSDVDEQKVLEKTPVSLGSRRIENLWIGDKPVPIKSSTLLEDEAKQGHSSTKADFSRDGVEEKLVSLDLAPSRKEDNWTGSQHPSSARVSIQQQEAESKLIIPDFYQTGQLGDRPVSPIIVKLEVTEPDFAEQEPSADIVGPAKSACTDGKQILADLDVPASGYQREVADFTGEIIAKASDVDETQQAKLTVENTDNNLSKIDEAMDGDVTDIDSTETDKINQPETAVLETKAEEAELVGDDRNKRGEVPLAHLNAQQQPFKEGTATNVKTLSNTTHAATYTNRGTIQPTTDDVQDANPQLQIISLDTKLHPRSPSPSLIAADDTDLPFQEEINTLQTKIDQQRAMISSDKKQVDECVMLEEQLLKCLKENQEKRSALSENIKECETSLTGLEEEMAVFQSKRALALIQKQALEEERIVLEQRRLENENLVKEYLEKKRIEQERLEKEHFEQKFLEQGRIEQECLEQERPERERIEQERIEKERIEKERLEKERIEKERIEKERIEKEQRLEKERLQKECLEKEHFAQELERIEQEHIRTERLEKERLERERSAKQHPTKLHLEEQHHEMEHLEKKHLEQERIEMERFEKQLEGTRTEKRTQKFTTKELLDKEQFVRYLERKDKEKREKYQREKQLREQERLEREILQQFNKEHANQEEFKAQREAAEITHSEAMVAMNRVKERKLTLEQIATFNARDQYTAPSVVSRDDSGSPPFPYKVKLDFRPIYHFKPINVWIHENQRPFDAVEAALKNFLNDLQIDTLCSNDLFRNFMESLNKRHARKMKKKTTSEIGAEDQ